MSVNPELLKMARNNVKQAFVAAGDPAMGAAPADPAMAGGAPPMDPATVSYTHLTLPTKDSV